MPITFNDQEMLTLIEIIEKLEEFRNEHRERLGTADRGILQRLKAVKLPAPRAEDLVVWYDDLCKDYVVYDSGGTYPYKYKSSALADGCEVVQRRALARFAAEYVR